MARTTIFGLSIDDPSLAEILGYIDTVIAQNRHEYITTINSELLQLSMRLPDYKQALENASLRLCDGIGVQWAAAFTHQSYPTIVNLVRAPISLLGLLLHPASAQKVIQHRTTGRLLFEDLLEHASKQKYRVFLLGGGPDVARQAAEKAQKRYPGLVIAGTYEGDPKNVEAILKNLKKANILFVAYGSPKQELFIHQYISHLQSNITIGVGGTFDAYVGAKPLGSPFRQIKPPHWVHRLGLESFWRLITQPNRFIRVWKSVAVLIIKAVFC